LPSRNNANPQQAGAGADAGFAILSRKCLA
jgi:hypothetical protein